MRNFDFLLEKRLFKPFATVCIEAEDSLSISPSTCAILSRRALEIAVKWVYQNDNSVKIPYQENLSSLIHDRNFLDVIDDNLLPLMKYIVKLGNTAAHTNVLITKDEAVLALHHLYQFISWVDYCYADDYKATDFSEDLLPQSNEMRVPPEKLRDLYENLSKKDLSIEELRNQNIELRKELTEKRIDHTENIQFNIDNITEFDTRKKYIDLDLKLVGWTIGKNVIEEYPVNGMPSKSGKGSIDYALVGKNGKIIGIIEAKRTTKDANVGRQQAKLYADCIEAEQGLRPIIFYTNGFETYIWDDNYPARKISGYYNQEELQLLIDRRIIKKPLVNIDINSNITNRPYQIKSILSVCDAFSRNQRKALLVMATGSGKTRTAISVVDILTRHNWVKNVLFLADRTALLKQAYRNFNALMPHLSLCNLLENKVNPEDSRMVFSTYKTMMNAIDETKTRNGNKLFTIGHFDLIIIDESHRSIYHKYRSIFDYFDGMLLGLTATPKDEVDKNTYSIFDLENGVPTFAYELDQAVNDKYLVDYKTVEKITKIQDDGIRYEDLSEEEKIEFDNTFEEDSNVRDIDSSAINRWLFNAPTVDIVLKDLMTKGIRVSGGDKVGKSIIFAKNHNHALFIKKRFDVLFPELGSNFTEIIDNHTNYYQSLIDDFSNVNKMPQIAISVDMLDTGIDIPELVNLVFFKKVRSKSKFWQMIGRGTRLCPDLFGLGLDKEYFLIFDYLRNFEYFRANEKGIETKSSKTITEKIFNVKVDIVRELQELEYQKDPYIEYRKKLIEDLYKEIQSLNQDNFRVRQHIRYIHKYLNKAKWQSLSLVQTNELKEHISPLISPYDDDELAKRFDFLMLTIELAKLQQNNATQPVNRVIQTAERLSKQGSIPQVKEKSDIINKVQTEDFWVRANLPDLEEVRMALRELIKLIDRDAQRPYYTNFEDEVIFSEENESFLTANNLQSYRKKVEYYLKEHQDEIAVYKLRNNKPLTKQDVETLERVLWNELGSKEQYEKDFGDTPITKLVRKTVGIERQAVNEAFAAFLTEERLNIQQARFVELIIDYIVKNGTLETQNFQQDPFTREGSIIEIFKENLSDAKQLLSVIDSINRNSEYIS